MTFDAWPDPWPSMAEPAPPVRSARDRGIDPPSPESRRQIAGLEGQPVELRRAPGGYWQVFPRPTPESQRALYEEAFYESDKASYLDEYERDRDYWDATWSMRRKMMEKALPPSRRRLLDVGCSGGFLLASFEQHGWHGVGIEPSPRAAEWAARKYGLEVFRGELLDYPRAGSASGPAAFDAIHSAQVLEHVLDPEACVERIASLLAPGGIAYIEVPNDFNVLQEAARERLDKPAWWVAPDHHLNYFDDQSLSALLARHGLHEIDRLASFPIEMFLLMGEDYVGDPAVGAACHQRRMAFERALVESGRVEDLSRMYRAFASASIGRTIGILARKTDSAGR